MICSASAEKVPQTSNLSIAITLQNSLLPSERQLIYCFNVTYLGKLNALQSKQLRDPFKDWPELDIMEFEVTDSSEDSQDSDASEIDE